MKLNLVKTPNNLKFSDDDSRTLHDLGSTIMAEANNCWTEQCSLIMRENPKLLFLYDRFEYSLGNAYGNRNYKIALNPMMLICYHPDCLKKPRGPIVRLKHMFYLQTYLIHLQDHLDNLGAVMKLRFGAIMENCFASPDTLDELSMSPNIMQPNLTLNCNVVVMLEKYGINRELTTNYICHWKDKLIEHGIINSDMLSFQEDDALIHTILHFPNPVKDWSVWNTVYFYSLKFYCSISATALNLYRGITNYLRLNRNTNCSNSVKDFASTINHAAPSLTSYQRLLPALNYSNEVYHGGEVLYHIKGLERSKDSLSLDYPSNNVIRYPITLGIDEQEINAGTFIHGGVLHGLDQKMGANEIKEIGLNKLNKHLAETNKFIKAVREYRATDFNGIIYSNIFSEFLSYDLNGVECSNRLDKVMSYTKSCRMCLLAKIPCHYDRIDDPCENCAIQKVLCISLVVMHVLWDMGSGHKKSEKEMYHLTLESPAGEMFSSNIATVGFGGLHVCKALVCTCRNYVLFHEGEHFGINILNELKQSCSILQTINNSVFIGRDKQSDYLSYMAVGEKVQESLKANSKYLINRVPEKYLTYKENAKSQKRIIMPTAMANNRNGDLFILDAGASCLHVIDNSTIAKVYLVGKYQHPSLIAYKSMKNVSGEIHFGTELVDMHVNNEDDVVILDASREEVVLLKRCVIAKGVPNTNFYVLKMDGLLSVVYHSDMFILRRQQNAYFIQKLSFKLPKKGSKENPYNLNYKISVNISLAVEADVRCIFSVPYSNMLGCFCNNKSINIIVLGVKVVNTILPLDVESDVKPYVSADGKMLSWSTTADLSVHQLSVDKSVSTKLVDKLHFNGRIFAFSLHGKVLSAAIYHKNQFAVLECGSLGFGISFCQAVTKLYHAISYVPPHGDRQKRNTKLESSTENAESCCALLESMQQNLEATYVGRVSFQGCNGIPWSATISCLRRTVDSWKVLKARMEVLQPGSSEKIYSHSITNESYVEHAFGFTKKKGQGHNQSMEEYVQSKRTLMVDFQMRMCEFPFCQHTKVKLRDKGYQQLEFRDVPMSLTEFKQIFSYSVGTPTDAVLSEEDHQVLKKAYLLSKYVPRQSNRCKWRATSGQIPSMLTDNSKSGSLYENDLVFHRTVNGRVVNLVVVEDAVLTDILIPIKVRVVGEKDPIQISVEELLLDREQIFTVPSNLYHLENEEVVLSDTVQPLFEDLCDKSGSGFSDKDWAILADDNEGCHTDSVKKRQREIDFTVTASKKKKVKSFSRDPIDEKLQNFWKSILPPVSEAGLINKWVACKFRPTEIAKGKLKNQLIFGKLYMRFCDDDSNVECCWWQVDCCKPYNLVSDERIVTEVKKLPDGTPGDLWLFSVHDILSDDFDVSYKSNCQWALSNIDNIIHLFQSSEDSERKTLLQELLE